MIRAMNGAYIRSCALKIMDLSKVAKVSNRHPGLRVVKRVLRSINTSIEPVSSIGFLTRNDTDLAESISIMEEGSTLMKDEQLPPGLSTIEIDNGSKITNASGQLAYAYFLTDTYPWLVNKEGNIANWDTPASVGKIFNRVLLSMGYSSDTLRLFNVDHFGNGGPACFYKKGSSYGLCPYVPGRSKMNTLALMHHNIVAGGLASSIRKERPKSKEAMLELFANAQLPFTAGEPAHPYGHNIMMISRARPIGLKKPLPRWRVDLNSMSLRCDSEEAGFRAGTREIKAVPAFINLLFSPYADLFSEMIRMVPGLHVGHQIVSASFLRECSDAWASKGYKTALHIEDISGYDNSVNENHLESFRVFLRYAAYMNDATDMYLRAIDVLGIATAGLFDRSHDDITLLSRDGGIASGFRGTTMYGTMINLITIVDCLCSIHHSTPDVILSKCANFNSILGGGSSTLKDTTWGILLKGDDLILFSKEGWIMSDEFIAARAKQGIKTDVEPGPIFLMQYIDIKKPRAGYQFPYCPAGMAHIKTFESYGLVLKRLGNRLIFNEHAITDVRVARLAITANLEDTFFHPKYQFLCSTLISRLNRYDPIKWRDAAHLRAYVVSDRGRKDMLDYAQHAGVSDPFLKELSRRRDMTFVDREQSSDYTTDVVSGLPPWAGEVLDSMESITLPSLTQRLGLTKDDLNLTVREGKSTTVMINENVKAGSHDWLSPNVMAYGKQIFKLLTEIE